VPNIDGNEWKYIKKCLDTGWVSSSGAYVDQFEDKMKTLVGTKYAIATASGTAALHLSLLASGVKETDEVIVPTLTFVAAVNVVHYCNAQPILIDCTKDSLCLDAKKVAEFLLNECKQKRDGFTYNKKTKKRIKAMIPVHVFGHPCDMDLLCELSKTYNIALIEDASESIGSEYKGRKTGSFGLAGCFSFNGNKMITTGGGGMIVTNDEGFAKKVKHLSTQAKADAFEYDHDEVGYNYRLNNVQAALGVAQLEKLEEYMQIKRNNATYYRDKLYGLDDVEVLGESKDVTSNFWFYTLRVPFEDKTAVLEHLGQHGIQSRPIWKLMHMLPMYLQCETFKIENAIEAYKTCINLPCSVGLTKDELDFIISKVQGYFTTKNSKEVIEESVA